MKVCDRVKSTWRDHAFAWTIVVAYYAIGIWFYRKYENWNFLEAVFEVTVIMTTEGYGCYHPTTEFSRSISLVFFCVGPTFVLNYLQHVFGIFYLGFRDRCIIFVINRGSSKRRKPNQQTVEAYYPLASIAIIIIAITFATIFYKNFEDWSWVQSYYFSVVTVVTEGYGDVCIKNENSRIFGVFLVTITGLMFTNMQWRNYFNDSYDEKFNIYWREAWLTEYGTRGMSNERFVADVLVQSYYIDPVHTDHIQYALSQCSRQNSVMNEEDIAEFMRIFNNHIATNHCEHDHNPRHSRHLKASSLSSRLKNIDNHGVEMVTNNNVLHASRNYDLISTIDDNSNVPA